MTARPAWSRCALIVMGIAIALASAPAAVRSGGAGERDGAPGRDSVYEEAEALMQAGDYPAAERMLRALLAKNSRDARAMAGLGLAYQDRGDKAGALKLFKDAVAADPGDPSGHFFLGRAHFLKREASSAIDEFLRYMDLAREAVSIGNFSRDVYIKGLRYVSAVFFELKEYALAKRAIEEIITLDPKDQMAVYNLGAYYYIAERSRSKAYQYFNKAAGLDPQSSIAKKAEYAIEFMRNNPDPRVVPDFSFLDQR